MEPFENEDLFRELAGKIPDPAVTKELLRVNKRAQEERFKDDFFRYLARDVLSDVQYKKLLDAGKAAGFDGLDVRKIITKFVVYKYYEFQAVADSPFEPHVIVQETANTEVHVRADKLLRLVLLRMFQKMAELAPEDKASWTDFLMGKRDYVVTTEETGYLIQITKDLTVEYTVFTPSAVIPPVKTQVTAVIRQFVDNLKERVSVNRPATFRRYNFDDVLMTDLEILLGGFYKPTNLDNVSVYATPTSYTASETVALYLRFVKESGELLNAVAKSFKGAYNSRFLNADMDPAFKAARQTFKKFVSNSKPLDPEDVTKAKYYDLPDI